MALLVATTKMKEDYQRFPEILAFDATYNKNQLKLPIVTYMAVDGRGEGRVIAYAIICNERLETVTSILAAVKAAHNMKNDSVKTVLVDKDMSEIAAVREIFPTAQLVICLFHSSTNIFKALKKDVQEIDLRADVHDVINHIYNNNRQ